MTFLQHEVFHETSYQQNIISKTLEARRELRRTGKSKIGRTPNFSIMEVFDEAEGLGNIYRQEYSEFIADQKIAGRTKIRRMNREARGGSLHGIRTWCQQSTPREGSVQLKVNKMKISSDGKQVNFRPIDDFYDGEAEALSIAVRPGQSVPLMIKWRYCSYLVQFHGFRSVEVLKLDTPPGSPKNCPGAKGGFVRVQISLSRLVSFFMVKPRFVQVEISQVQSSRPLGFGKVLSDQPAASRLEHCDLACLNSTWNLG
uniref:Uncharacterized protein n=1 Tax=Brassica campestris TaxID=3711 RepID=M4E0H2_BRACM